MCVAGFKMYSDATFVEIPLRFSHTPATYGMTVLFHLLSGVKVLLLVVFVDLTKASQKFYAEKILQKAQNRE